MTPVIKTWVCDCWKFWKEAQQTKVSYMWKYILMEQFSLMSQDGRQKPLYLRETIFVVHKFEVSNDFMLLVFLYLVSTFLTKLFPLIFFL